MEVFFREAKQLLGFADSSARTERAVRRVAPFVGLLYTTLVLWFLENLGRSFEASVPIRPWYSHKSGLSFEDILRTARSVIATVDILDLGNGPGYFEVTTPSAPPPANSGEKLAA